MRRCTGCNEQRPKRELVRVVRSPEGEVSMDLSGKKAGNFFEHGGLLKAFAFGSFLKSDLLNAAAYGNPGTGIGF